MLPQKPPSILEDGDGLVHTHVTLEDVNLVIRQQMKTESQLTLDSKMEVIGDGNGFSSCVILITCNWSTPSENLPKKIVLKIISFFHIKSLVENAEKEGLFDFKEEDKEKMSALFETAIQKMHNQELEFYRVLSHGDSEKLLIPKLFFSNKFDEFNKTKGFIGMEYIEGTTIRHTFENCSIDEIQPVLKVVAYIQALTFSSSESDIKKIENNSVYIETMKQMMGAEGMKGIFMHTKRQNPERFGSLVDRVEELSAKILDFDRAFNLNKFVGISKNVFVHGDLWSANILWTTGENGDISARKVLDYQLTRTGNPAEDLVRFICSTLSGADRREHLETILEQFYGYFKEAMGDGEVPYTFEQLKQSFKMFFPVGGLAILALFGPAVDMKLKFFDEEIAERYREVVSEKVECLLEDVEKYYLESI